MIRRPLLLASALLAAIGLALSGMTLMITGAFASLTGKNAKH